MTKLSELKPKKKESVCVLLKRAGIKVERNQYFLSEWAHVEPRKVAVLNFWFAQMKQRGQDIVFDKNFCEYSDAREKRNKDRVKQAISEKLPIRIIVLDGKMGSPKGSIVSKRQLDPAIWRVTALDQNTGNYTLTRGAHFIDQFSIQETPDRKPERRKVSGLAFDRNPVVRENVRIRANGKFERCGALGFPTLDGGIYLETHHVIPLSENGSDVESNVAALCPNHHREAHHGRIKDEMRKKLLKRLKRNSD